MLAFCLVLALGTIPSRAAEQVSVRIPISVLRTPLPKLPPAKLVSYIAAYGAKDPAQREAIANALDLSRIDPADTGKFSDSPRGERHALKALKKDQQALAQLQDMLYASGERSELLILQAMDAGGKDGIVKHVMSSLNPQGVDVKSFKKPTEAEAKEHYMARVDRALVNKEMVAVDSAGRFKGNGRIGIFNRGPDEDILNPLVYPERYPGMTVEDLLHRIDEINAWEKKLAEGGVTVRKILLLISKAEQKSRLEARRDTPGKEWKITPADIEARAKWDDFQRAYGLIAALRGYTVVSADRKWYGRYKVGRLLRKDLEAMGLSYPKPAPGLKRLVIPD